MAMVKSYTERISSVLGERTGIISLILVSVNGQTAHMALKQGTASLMVECTLFSVKIIYFFSVQPLML